MINGRETSLKTTFQEKGRNGLAISPVFTLLWKMAFKVNLLNHFIEWCIEVQALQAGF